MVLLDFHHVVIAPEIIEVLVPIGMANERIKVHRSLRGDIEELAIGRAGDRVSRKLKMWPDFHRRRHL
jgi:hypothetical protein